MREELFTKRELHATRAPARRGRRREQGSASIRGVRFRWYCGSLQDHVLCRTWAGLKRRQSAFLAMVHPRHIVTFEICDAHGNRIRTATNDDYRAYVAAMEEGE